MNVNRYATRAGKQYEVDLMKYLRSAGLDVERLRLTGAEDEGDLLIRTDGPRFVAEAKRARALDLAGWVKEAQAEWQNYAAHRGIASSDVGWIVIHKARGKSIGQSYVTMTLDEWVRMRGGR